MAKLLHMEILLGTDGLRYRLQSKGEISCGMMEDIILYGQTYVSRTWMNISIGCFIGGIDKCGLIVEQSDTLPSPIKDV
jgi:hypothetical protein